MNTPPPAPPSLGVTDGLVFALVTIVWLSAIASLVSIRKLPVSLYTTLIRISLCLTTFHVAARTCYLYISQLQTLIVSFLVGLVLYISIMLFLIAEVTFLAIIAPFASGITPGVLWSVRTLIMLIALGIGFNTLSNFYDKYWYDLAKQVAYVFTLIGAIYEVFQQFFLLYFVIWKLKHAPMSFRIKYAGACGLAVTIMAASAWCNGLRLDYPRPRRLAAYAFADAFILCALLCMQLVRSSLQLESHAVSASTSPHDVLQSKLPGVPLRQKKILRTDMAIKLSRTQLETQIESRRPSKTLADMNQTQ
nr:hypothetical protein HK105_004528 [Polyrhizophydium stewartii]